MTFRGTSQPRIEAGSSTTGVFSIQPRQARHKWARRYRDACARPIRWCYRTAGLRDQLRREHVNLDATAPVRIVPQLCEQFLAARPAFWRLNDDLIGAVLARRRRMPDMRRFRSRYG